MTEAKVRAEEKAKDDQMREEKRKQRVAESEVAADVLVLSSGST